jgi:DNA/RNA endonuclease YhcR with UshA esterase domain
MKDTLVRYALLALVGVSLGACDDEPTDLNRLGTPSDVRVRAYLEVNGNGQYDDGTDTPLDAVTVTLVHTQTGATVEATTGSDGVAAFTGMPAGAYTATLDEADLPAGLVDVSVVDPGLEQTIVAPFEGAAGGVDAAFAFRYLPATIQGTVYQDVDRSGDFDPAIDDVTAAGVTVYLYRAASVTGTPTDSATTGADGTFSFQVYPDTYTLDVVTDDLTEIVTAEPITVTVGADETVDNTVVVRSAVQDIVDAESRADDTVVLVDGVVTVDRGTISGSYFWIQDATGGVKVYVGSGWTGSYTRGDQLRVQGPIVTNFGEKSIEATSIEVLGTAPVPDPILLDGTEFLSGVHQGELVTVDSLFVDSVGTGGSYNVYVTDPGTSDEFVIRVDSDTGIAADAFTAGQSYTVTGVSSPFSGQEQIYPRSEADIFPLGGAPVTVGTARLVPDSTDVTVNAVVHTATGTISGSYFFMHDATGGIKVYVGNLGGSPTFARGDSVQVTGEVVTRFGEKQIEATAVTVLGTGTVLAPVVVTGAELLTAVTQGNLVTVETVTVQSVGTGSSYNVTVLDPETSTTFIIRVDSDTGIAADAFVEGGSYTVTGVSSPFGGAEQLYPRSAADITSL